MKNYGFSPEDIVIEPDEWLGGATLGAVVNPSGDWSDFLPAYEPQAERYETQGCTVWGSQNQLEILYKFLFGIEPNYSERFTYILAEVNPNKGQNPHKTYEAIRKYGLIDHKELPVPKTLREFLKPNPMTQKYLDLGLQWKGTHAYNHQWELSDNQDRVLQHRVLKNALKYGPVGVSVTAWQEDNGVFIDGGFPNTHWCVLFKYDGENPVIFDSYDHSIKKLASDHLIQYAKGISISKDTTEQQIGIMQKIISLLQELLSRLTTGSFGVIHRLFKRGR